MNITIESVRIASKLETHIHKQLMAKLTNNPLWAENKAEFVFNDPESDVKITVFKLKQKRYHGVVIRYDVKGGYDLKKRIKQAVKNSGTDLSEADKHKILRIRWSAEMTFDTDEQAEVCMRLAARAKSPAHLSHDKADDDSISFCYQDNRQKQPLAFTRDKNVILIQMETDEIHTKNMLKNVSLKENTSNSIQKACNEKLEGYLRTMFGTGRIPTANAMLSQTTYPKSTDKAYESLERFIHTSEEKGVDSAMAEAEVLHEENQMEQLTVQSIGHYVNQSGNGFLTATQEETTVFKGPIALPIEYISECQKHKRKKGAKKKKS